MPPYTKHAKNHAKIRRFGMVFDWRVSFRRPLSDAPALGIRPPRLPLLLAVAACSAQKAARRCALSGGRSIGRHHRPPAPRLFAGGAGGRRRRFLFVCALRLPRRWLPRFGAWGWSAALGLVAASVGRGAGLGLVAASRRPPPRVLCWRRAWFGRRAAGRVRAWGWRARLSVPVFALFFWGKSSKQSFSQDIICLTN